MSDARQVVLTVEDLKTYFSTEEGQIRAVDGVSFSLEKGRTLAIVGESGCGKSVTAFSVMRLIQPPGRIAGGTIRLYEEGRPPLSILELKEGSRDLNRLRGGTVSMIFQDALAALSPVHTIGNQLVEALCTHHDLSPKDAEKRALEMLEKVGLSQPGVRFNQYPHELSGGMRQRVMIAIALITEPRIVIADEPTTALDVTIQLQILDLIKKLQHDQGCAVLLITHDLGVVAHSADEVAVMYLGKVVERGDVRTLLKRPRHPYTMGLLESLPSRASGKVRLPSIKGSVPALTEIPPGCPFHPRCPHAEPGICDDNAAPPLVSVTPGHDAACVRLEQIHGKHDA